MQVKIEDSWKKVLQPEFEKPYFKELTNTNARLKMYQEQQNLIEQDIAPFGFLDDGINEHEETTVDEYGDVWHPVVRKGM